MRIKVLIFDWGNTVMRDFALPGPMSDWPEVAWIPALEDALKDLSTRFICVIATSAEHSDAEEMLKALERVGADKYFSHFFSAKELGASKPNPEFFKIITEKLGISAENCLAIGDKYKKDIVAAKAAGLKAVLFDEDGKYKGQSENFHTIRSMNELVDAIDVLAK